MVGRNVRRRLSGGGKRTLGLEVLEPRWTLTWVGVPPVLIAPPVSPVAITLNAQSDASGAASIASTEVDYYAFTAPVSGSYSISATTPTGSVDTVLGVFSASGQRLAYNDDIARTNTDSRLSINLTAGTRYLIGVTNYATWSRGGYAWAIDGPAAAVTPPTQPPTSPVTAFPDVAYYGGTNDWNLNAINAPEAWAQGYHGQGAIVAVVDTGVDMNHPDLVNSLWVNAGEIAGNRVDDDGNGFVDDTSGWDFSSGDNNPDDGNGHGTHVAGTIAADANGFGATGVAPDATIMPVRVLGSNGSGTSSGVAAGIRYASQMGADIINLSLGGGFSSVIQSAIQYAQQLGVLVVAAAGNESASSPGYPARFSSALSNVLSVGAYSSSGAIANFSNDVGTSGAVQVDAPGVSVYSTYIVGRYGSLSGTSMATPHVAGLAALALSANPNLTAAGLRTLIVDGANRAIAGSDARGGVNAALSVALAAAGQSSTSSAATAAQAQTWSPLVTIRGIFLFLSDSFNRPLQVLAATEQIAAPQHHESTPATAEVAQTSDEQYAVRDQALVSLSWTDEADLDQASRAADAASDDWLDDLVGLTGVLEPEPSNHEA